MRGAKLARVMERRLGGTPVMVSGEGWRERQGASEGNDRCTFDFVRVVMQAEMQTIVPSEDKTPRVPTGGN